ncbi:hypothetical protein IM697_17670 [Streptomyces ferrugineus]|uniref:Uncharacterized protein n=1 Tax=Streptomyces ferrugineus TaxID=1413221 RepID=A0A7M2SVX6_9ACTN|nr:hypothetical protein [Streptomyces ferrugineus]QOV40059.1 hypothetical protein IM697_17670 [Streptomyces ferrugineus]
METIYGLYVEGSKGQSDIASFLLAEGATRSPDPHNPSYWYVPAAARGPIKEWLENRSISFISTYEFQATSTDIVEDLAGHLGLSLLSAEAARQSAPLMAKDPDDFRIIVNNRMLELLAPITQEVIWGRYEQYAELSFLRSAPELPDPIQLSAALSIECFDGDRWDVSGDGRSIMTRRNLDTLNRVGIAYSTAQSVNGNVYPREKFPTFSGRVIQSAKQAGVDLVIYLPPEGLEIKPW